MLDRLPRVLSCANHAVLSTLDTLLKKGLGVSRFEAVKSFFSNTSKRGVNDAFFKGEYDGTDVVCIVYYIFCEGGMLLPSKVSI